MSRRRLRRWAAGLALGLGVPLAGCSQPAATRDDLAHALVEAHSALATAGLALDALDHRRSTAAVAQTACEDMSSQIADAGHTIESITVNSDQDRADRDATLTAIASGEAALLTARDDLDARAHVDRAPLDAADAKITDTLEQIRGDR